MTCGFETKTNQSRTFRFSVRAERSAPRKVRHVLAEIIPSGPDLQTALLLADELVTNAVMHGPRSKPIRITLEADKNRLRLEVFSRGRLEPPARRTIGGYGLKIVERLSEDHGLEEVPGGVRAWFVIQRDGS